MIYTVRLTEVVERQITCTVEANSEEEAKKKAYDCEWLDSDEDMVDGDIVEVKRIQIVK